MPKASPTTPDNPNADVSALGYEQARDELVSVVARLEAGAQTLEESLALWERGEALAARCQEWLDGARQRLTAVRAKAGPQSDDPDTDVDPDEITPDDIEEQA
ncbi:exodeoxyribonuclease VII small subunit [Cellulomonas sp. URHE0023]|uniref:exodeoxyribonuclease VII small subunit n=1 Tax=Cellulomonas sp. URHE0023 TaxID=1380354 RepID=UPI00068C45C4|nr:exodeoxyribonuclease VII small subunit [Cellulomonas sp. URHE0023]